MEGAWVEGAVGRRQPKDRAAFFSPDDGRRVAYGVGQGPVAEAVGGFVIAGRDAGVSRYRKKKRRNLLMEAPCSLAPPGRSAAKGSNCVCCII